MITVILPTGEFNATATIGLVWSGVFTTVFLILLLSSKEILTASTYYDEKAEYSFNIFIIPLLLTFFAIVIFKTMEVLY